MRGVLQNKIMIRVSQKKTKLSDLGHFMTMYFTKYDIVTYLHTYCVCIFIRKSSYLTNYDGLFFLKD